MSAGTDVRLIHSDNMTISFWNITAGTIVPPHQHVHESVLSLSKNVSVQSVFPLRKCSLRKS